MKALRRRPTRRGRSGVAGAASQAASARRALAFLALAGWFLIGPFGWAQDEPDDATPVTLEEGDVRAAFEGKVVTGRIDGDITLAEAAFVSRLIDQARLEKAEIIALELNTFGGRVDAAVAIRDALMDAPQTSIVFINKRAISAGALISFACDKIVMSSGGTIGAATPIQQVPGETLPQPVEEKYLSYFRQEMRATAESQGRDGDIAEAMVDKDNEIEGLVEKGKLLTLTTVTALAHDMADAEAESLSGALDAMGFHGDVVDVDRSWSEQLVAFLTSQAIAGLLSMAMIVLAYMEWQTPGFGVFGALAIACFLLLYFSHYMVNLAGYEELIFFGLGVILIVVEMFFIPGLGIPGILGALSVLTSLVLIISAGDWSDLHFDNPITVDAVGQVAIAIGVAFVAILALIRLLPQTHYGGGIVLGQELAAEGGWTSHDTDEPSLLGETGVTLSALRPSGKAHIGDQRLRVETEGDFLDEGTPVKVVRQVEGRIVVRRATDGATEELT
ncbi:MAG: hypothetical protein MPN21_11045 [Thermoanaerobaculia bacterium]|nr:hypothetical protein [Thermoanaerobaculia bacterium]